MERVGATTPQLEDGYLSIANALFEAIIRNLPHRVPGPVLVFLAVMRETYGFNRKSAEISTKRFNDLTGIGHRNNIYRSIKEAVESNLITAIKNDGKTNPTYSIQKDYTKWKPAIKNDCAIKNDGTCNQKRLHKQSKMIAVCMLNTPSKDTSKDIITPTSPPEKPKKTKKQIPADYALTDELLQIAKKHGINGDRVESVFEHFKAHHESRGTRTARWDKAWLTWVLNDKKFNKNQNYACKPVKYNNPEEDRERLGL